MEEARITLLEQRTAQLSDSFVRVEHKIDGITDALASLVRIEERQMVINSRLSEGSEKMKCHDDRLKAVEIAMPNLIEDAKSTKDHETRLKCVEVVIPGLVEKSSWVVKGLLGVVAIVGLQILHMVLSK